MFNFIKWLQKSEHIFAWKCRLIISDYNSVIFARRID